MKYLKKNHKQGLATLLEGAGYFFYISSIQKYILTLFWLKKCVKLIKKVILVTTEVPTVKLWEKKENVSCCISTNSAGVISRVQLQEKWYGNKMVKSPYNCVIFPLTQPQVANQQQKNLFDFWFQTCARMSNAPSDWLANPASVPVLWSALISTSQYVGVMEERYYTIFLFCIYLFLTSTLLLTTG